MAIRTRAAAETNSELETEAGFFDSHRQAWIGEHYGEFALIKGCDLLGFYRTLLEAWQAGLNRFGNQAMFISPVLKEGDHWNPFDPDALGNPWAPTTTASLNPQV